MRCYTTDGSKINRGFALSDSEGICAGKARVPFAISFSDILPIRLNNCDVEICRNGEIKLATPPDNCSDSKALVLIDQVQPNGKIPAVNTQGEATIFLSKTYQKYVRLYTSRFELCWTGLVALEAGSSITITHENHYSFGDSFWHLIGLVKRINCHVVGHTIFSFDGTDVSLSHQWTVNGEPRTADTLFPLI
jgi:hypothetical protein